MSSEQHRWKLVDDFINAFNTHRADNFQPSDLICVDESMSRWYGQGGNWINHGLPQYISIDRKPENGCEIQNAACGRSGVMMQLRLVKSQVHEENNAAGVVDDVGLPHGASILKKLVLPWAQTDRIVCADSYFASVATAAEMKRIGLRFIGVVKTATRQYPMAYLSRLELTERGEFKGLVTKAADGTCSILPLFGWTVTGAILLQMHHHWRKEKFMFGNVGVRLIRKPMLHPQEYSSIYDNQRQQKSIIRPVE